MRRVGRGLAVLMIGAVFFTVTAGTAGAKTVSDEKYAKKLCGTLNGAVDDVSGIEPSQSADPATSQTETLASVDEAIASLEARAAKVKKLSPDDGGKKITKLFDAYIKELTSKIQDGRDEFAAAEPSSPAFTADLTVLGVALQNSALGLDDPFQKLSDNEDLLTALDEEKSCEGIVTVTIIGG